MDEYIERRTAIEHLNVWCGGCGSAVECILAEPIADVAPVVHGRWVCVNKIDPISGYRCSKCRRRVGFDLTPYCPNCGAKMDGGDNDETNGNV